MIDRSPARLVLENGTVFRGFGFGADRESLGEVVFNTSMTGYQEILTDPSYHGQIVVMTYPEIGNYGINNEDMESARPWVRGFVVRSLANRSSNYRSNEELTDYLKRLDIPGVYGIDTRKLVRLIRSLGAMKGLISIGTDLSDEALIDRAKSGPSMLGMDMTRDVMTTSAQSWSVPLYGTTNLNAENAPHVVAMDFGMKWNIPRHLVSQGCRVTVVPGNFSADQILDFNPDGIFVSNGPGDPEPLVGAVACLSSLITRAAEKNGTPIFGICLGHQLLGQALGGRTYKLKFGHRGANHPVQDRRTEKVEITTQNHGFAVDPSSLPDHVAVTHVNLNDQTVEGIRHKRLPVFCVQYHPEASAGPHDSSYLFDEFKAEIERNRV
ncbi:MAG: glutamine-hydrolyzing carbamoyl-phosphate synthase small subunit [Planctomycetota bacterium]|nr:glutamine-hydrolyzing carbamoyl-phosphate synthase small subunit [Planctomycetota bacterium]RLS26534.1 MAG: carbamoyl-phosphate synthase small subunit [Planctomycetota bacterium]